MVAKCGDERVWHWAHKARSVCDPWWEHETEWHRAWKDQFPADWQEIVHHAKDGERHIADVKTHDGWVLEFQNSNIAPEERRSRETFYPKMVWVVNGAKQRDRQQSLNAWEGGVPVGGRNSWVRRIFPDECVLARKWAGGPVPVFLDFGEEQMLWWLFGTSFDGWIYVGRFPRAQFTHVHRSGAADIARKFDEFVNDLGKLVAGYESHLRAQRF